MEGKVMMRPTQLLSVFSAALLAFLLAGTSANALTIDFVSLAVGNEGSGIPSFVFNDIEGSGINLTVTARDLADVAGVTEATDPYPYLDDLLSGRPGGLGVCQTVNCSGVPDDNLGWAGAGEVLILDFSAPITMQSVSFNNGDHFQVFLGDIGINVGAGNPTDPFAFGDIFTAANLVATNLSGTRFSFIAPETFDMVAGSIDKQVYIDTIQFIPEPSTLLLVGLGLATLGSRRRLL